MQLSVPWRFGQFKPYGSIPRIDWAHPITRGLVFYGYDVSGVVIDLAYGLKPTIFTPAIPSISSRFGAGLKYASSGGRLVFPATVPVNSGLSKLYSLACAWYITALPSVVATTPFGITELSNSDNA